MNIRHLASLWITILFASTLPLVAKDHLDFIYQPKITDEHRVNSKGVPLKDPVAILIQERALTHKRGGGDAYFTTPQRRAEIPAMIQRGHFDEAIRDMVVNGLEGDYSPVLFISVNHYEDGKPSMTVFMRNRDQDYYDPESMPDQIYPTPKTDLPSGLIKPSPQQPDYAAIENALSKDIERVVGEPVKLDITISIFKDWARVDGGVLTASGEQAINEETDYYFDLDLVAILKKSGEKWQVLKHVIAGDIAAAIEIPATFPDVPAELFPRLPPEITGIAPEPASERMSFIDGASNFRTGPSTKHQIISQPSKGTTATVLERQGNWIKLLLDSGETGWAHKQNLRKLN